MTTVGVCLTPCYGVAVRRKGIGDGLAFEYNGVDSI